MSYKNFLSTDLIDRGIQKDDMMCVRRALTNTCQFDRAFTKGKFDDGIEYALKNISEDKLYEAFAPDLFPLMGQRAEAKDPTLTEGDFNNALFYLTENFCPERIEDVKKLGRYLFHNEGKVTATNPPRRSPQRNRQKDTVRLLIVLGGAAVAITAAVLIVKAVQKNAAKQTNAVEALTNQVELLTNQVEELNVQVTQLTYQMQSL